REVVAELEQLVAEYPFRERFRCQLVLALYRAGRQADALTQCRQARTFLVEELGLEPGEELRAIEHSVLTQDPAISTPTTVRTTRRPTTLPHARRPVSALCLRLDQTGFEDSDPELVDGIVARFEEATRAMLETSGATVLERPAGELIGLFGLPVAH